jgi:hypothetical protein
MRIKQLLLIVLTVCDLMFSVGVVVYLSDTVGALPPKLCTGQRHLAQVTAAFPCRKDAKNAKNTSKNLAFLGPLR